MTAALPWVADDGGRELAGYRGAAGDCTCRAIAIAADLPYQAVYDRLNELVPEHDRRGPGRRGSARTGVNRRTYDALLAELGFTWTPTMTIGSGCRVHLAVGELPPGRLVCRLSRHVTAVIDGMVHDTYDPSRDGSRCVYGYWTAP